MVYWKSHPFSVVSKRHAVGMTGLREGHWQVYEDHSLNAEELF